ncbi:MAG: response regulator transcription factor, partial [Terriglobales bacterium]
MRILLTDDHTLFRQGLRQLLEAEYDMQVVGEAHDGGEAVARASELKPDIVLMDIGMPGLASFEAVRQIRKLRPETKVVFLSMYDDEDYLQQCLQAGGSGYLLKDSPADQLIAAIREVRRGGKFLSPRILSKLVEDISARNPGERFKPRLATLTPRERETLKFLAEGLSVKEVAVKLKLSTKTVEAHKFNLMRKLDLHNKAQ